MSILYCIICTHYISLQKVRVVLTKLGYLSCNSSLGHLVAISNLKVQPESYSL